ncbi:heparan-alpha-glucosaminide N-acetyltransferase-like isoform X2 [Athalia rosae]|uniref:heparan-alpha-glucosaminide N-acetyltransferase-like isoform X2 n=1 Tax=Athalia rosae TaxID=37344 RepID=UPI0020348ADF|nr:heparan-alpha-glucosaminide N-acetyltransferase-like isoform X2 [Athalia rosae]
MHWARTMERSSDCGGKELELDEACFSVHNADSKVLELYGHSWECWLCKSTLMGKLPPNSNTSFSIETKYPFHVYYTNPLEYCHTTFDFVEHGHYGWNLTGGSCSHIYTIYQPPNPYMPILAAFMLFFFVAATWASGTFIARSGLMSRLLRRGTPDVQNDLGRLQETAAVPDPPERITRSSTRAKFLDTFRGIAILSMIFVNNGGGKYWFFNHSPWNGLTLADFVLPFFAWIMGFTMVISMRTQLRISISRLRIIMRCVRRSLTLILLGLIINSISATKHNMHGTTLQQLRFTGILQLLGITYLICSTLEAIFTKAQRTFQYGRFGFLQDILDGWVQWLVIIAITATHLLITFLLPVPGCPTGYLGPGGLHEGGSYQNCTAGAAGYIDRKVLGSHIYTKKTPGIYENDLPYDPEGIMNTMSAVLLVYMGVQAGRIMLTYHKANSRIIRWLGWALITGIVAGTLCNFSKEDGPVSINKSMMTISYVLATTSVAFCVNAILYVLIDLQHWWNGAPFFYAGIPWIKLN